MSASGSARVIFNPDTDNNAVFPKHTSGKTSSGDRNKSATRTCSFKVSRRLERSPARLLRQLSDKVFAVLHLGRPNRRRPAANASTGGRTNPSIAPTPIDSYRAEAISDCIEFINSSSSLQRSNSVPTGSC
ncbi:Ubiquitinyl hydrolase 1 [Bertholletia excelsa]